MKRLKVIQIGIGHDHATAVLDSLLRLSEDFEVIGLAPLESERADLSERIGLYEKKIPILSPDEALRKENIDAVIVETEEEFLTTYALLAAQKGLAVHMDKPGGTEPKEFDRLIDTAKERETVFHIGYMYRYNEAISEAVEKAKSGELGNIYSVEAHMDCLHPEKKRQWLSRFSGGMMFYLGCHLIDLILRIMGAPEEILPMNQSTGIGSVNAKDLGFAVFRYPNGISFAKTCAAEFGGFERRQLVICGSKGTLELKPLEIYDDTGKLSTGVRYATEENGREWSRVLPITYTTPKDRYDGMMQAFAKMVRKEMKNPFDYEYERMLYRTLLRACGIRINEKENSK